ncbi:MAG: hypothetical protein ABIH85_07630 [Candidatus Omnitrophota bacterium]|nr:hypothetical protein [Candidatus Omnitrophota bacterium]
MSIVDKVKELPKVVLVLFIASKFIIGLGLGALLVASLQGIEWWLILIGIAMSIPGAYIIWLKK